MSLNFQYLLETLGRFWLIDFLFQFLLISSHHLHISLSDKTPVFNWFIPTQDYLILISLLKQDSSKFQVMRFWVYTSFWELIPIQSLQIDLTRAKDVAKQAGLAVTPVSVVLRELAMAFSILLATRIFLTDLRFTMRPYFRESFVKLCMK